MLRAPRKGAEACSLPPTRLRSACPAQMLNENIQVASLITDSLQQKVYNMALEELEGFLGRSVEPLAPLPVLKDHGSRGQAPQAAGGHLCCGAPSTGPGARRPSAHGAAVGSQGLLPQAPLS